jgi:hypothetical protein
MDTQAHAHTLHQYTSIMPCSCRFPPYLLSFNDNPDPAYIKAHKLQAKTPLVPHLAPLHSIKIGNRQRKSISDFNKIVSKSFEAFTTVCIQLMRGG